MIRKMLVVIGLSVMVWAVALITPVNNVRDSISYSRVKTDSSKIYPYQAQAGRVTFVEQVYQPGS